MTTPSTTNTSTSADLDSAPATQVYRLYIKTSPERLWEAITTSEFRRKYFHGGSIQSTFRPGASLRTFGPDGTIRGDNTVLESEPPLRLVHTWKSLYNPEYAAERESRLSWEITPMDGGVCQLTVIHDRLEGAPKTALNVAGGWMLILCNLKTVIETGEPMTPVLPG